MNILDDMNRIKEIDKNGILKVEEDFYQQLLDAREIIQNADLSEVRKKNSGIAFLGMGGSGFAGDIIKALIKDNINIPVEIVKGYKLPAFIKSNWLVVAVSYSGDTEETISAANQALERKCETLIICSGGKLEGIGRRESKVVIKIPPKLQPRGAIGYLFLPAYLALDKLGLIKVNSADIEEATNLIKLKAVLYSRKNSSDRNPAKKLALKISDRLPIIYGTEGLLTAVSYRLKCEINENSKTPCWCNNFPELNHNEIVGWERLKDITKKFILLIFREKDETARVKKRIDVTINIIKENIGEIIEIQVEGKSKLARALSTIYLGDMASVYLALLAGVDPTPVEKIKILKEELEKLN